MRIEEKEDGEKEDTQRMKWQRHLHSNQPYPDNYVDSSFLAHLVKTTEAEQPASVLQVALESAVLVEQISATILFLCCYGLLLHSGRPFFAYIAFADAACCLLLAGAISIVRLLPNRPDVQSSSITARTSVQWAQAIRFCCVVLVSLLALSPILKTLTQSYCNDSLWTLTGLLLLIHLITHDYSLQPGPRKVPGILSMNAAMSASILLASRLSSATHAFACISIAVQIFALLPIFRDHIRFHSELAHGILTFTTILMTASTLSFFSTLLVTAYVIGVLFFYLFALFFSVVSKNIRMKLTDLGDIPQVTAANIGM
jgi:phosphatidylinositol N-acetylglucosaminyltransferase subunit C